ncbi:hypothetical protein [Fodinicola feengrottensis]|uniref:hypothetical protein n=1 Tax=Fodinicola feengrottensis TaxID=435914 RepID=UPI0013D6AC07|nr:hypothetical protein [Fodinicola feengrottensis]
MCVRRDLFDGAAPAACRVEVTEVVTTRPVPQLTSLLYVIATLAPAGQLAPQLPSMHEPAGGVAAALTPC